MGVVYLVDYTVDSSWLGLVKTFEGLLRSRLGRRFRRVIARSGPEDTVYESNVLVVVDRVDVETIRIVAEAVGEAQRRAGVEGLNPMTIGEEEESTVEVFMWADGDPP